MRVFCTQVVRLIYSAEAIELASRELGRKFGVCCLPLRSRPKREDEVTPARGNLLFTCIKGGRTYTRKFVWETDGQIRVLKHATNKGTRETTVLSRGKLPSAL